MRRLCACAASKSLFMPYLLFSVGPIHTRAFVFGLFGFQELCVQLQCQHGVPDSSMGGGPGGEGFEEHDFYV